MSSTPASFHARLALDPGQTVFAILDGASIPDLPKRLWEEQPPHECLYLGDLEPDIVHTAPYLVQLETGHPFTDWLTTGCWGKHWGIFAAGQGTLLDMRKHFRRMLTVRFGDQSLLFRFYDPRILALYLPTCNTQELTSFFGAVQCYVAENEPPDTFTQFRFEGGKLQQKAVSR